MWLNRHEPADGTGAVFIAFDQTIARSDCRQRTVNIHIDGSLVLVNKTAMIRLTVKWGNLARRSVLANLHQMKWRAHEKSVCRLGLDHCHLRGNWRVRLCGRAGGYSERPALWRQRAGVIGRKRATRSRCGNPTSEWKRIGVLRHVRWRTRLGG